MPRALLVGALGLVAGCVGPFESADPETPPHVVEIDGVTYSCDDDVSIDNVCDEYERTEVELGIEPEIVAATRDDGRVVLAGLVYECDDTLPEPGEPCDEYEWEDA